MTDVSDLSKEEIQHRTNEIDTMLDALSHPGFSLIKDRFREAYELQDRLLNIQDERQLFIAQGRLVTIQQFLDLRELLKMERDWLNSENEEDDPSNPLEEFSNEFIENLQD